MSNYPRPQFGNSSVGFVYFPNAANQATATSGASESLDYIGFSNAPSTSVQSDYGNSSHQFRKPNNYYPRGNSNNRNYRQQQQQYGDGNYQHQKPFYSNQNRGRGNWRGNYQPRGDFNPHGNYNPRGKDYHHHQQRGSFVPRGNYNNPRGSYTPRGHRGNYNPRGNYQYQHQRGQNRNRRGSNKRYKKDIRRFVNKSMVEDPWAKLMDNLKFSGLEISSAVTNKTSSSHPKPCTMTSGELSDTAGGSLSVQSVDEDSVTSPSGQQVSSTEDSDESTSETDTNVEPEASTTCATVHNVPE